MDHPTKELNDWTRKEFLALPSRQWDEDIGEIDSLVILPMNYKHSSGYACMDLVACIGGKPIVRLSGCSDVIHIDGIGGYGRWNGHIPEFLPIRGWTIDCLRKSKLLRLFCDHTITVGPSLSSFDVYATNKYFINNVLNKNIKYKLNKEDTNETSEKI